VKLENLSERNFFKPWQKKTAQTQIVGIDGPGFDPSKNKLDNKKTQSRKNFPKNSENFF